MELIWSWIWVNFDNIFINQSHLDSQTTKMPQINIFIPTPIIINMEINTNKLLSHRPNNIKIAPIIQMIKPSSIEMNFKYKLINVI